jgi:neutral ceramidase
MNPSELSSARHSNVISDPSRARRSALRAERPKCELLLAGFDPDRLSRITYKSPISAAMKPTFLFTRIALLLLIPCSGAIASGWKAGFASIKITPETPVPMAGYAGRVKPFDHVESDLHAKALAIEDSAGNRAVLVTTDLIGITEKIAAPVLERIQQSTGLERRQVILSASHTHSGPMLHRSNLPIPGVAAQDVANLAAYTRELQDKLVALVEKSLHELEPVKLSFGEGIAHFTMNRREFTPRGIILGVNARGLVDRSVPVLRVTSNDGGLRAVVFSYACHNTTLTGSNFSLCGDYAGFAQRHIEQRHPEAQAMFMSGCGGDANPHPRGTMAWAREHGAALGEEVCRVLKSGLRDIGGPLKPMHKQAELPLQTFSREELELLANKGASWQQGNARELLKVLERGEDLPRVYSTPVGLWQFGNDLTLVALPGEIVVDYVPLIEKTVGPLSLWITAYCNDVFGYLPSARVHAEGGYECRGLYTAPGFFAPEAENVLLETVRELAQQAGRSMPKP